MKAIWDNTVIVQSDDIVQMEGNSYFPVNAVKPEYFKESKTQTVCHWKGTASYYDLEMNGEIKKDAAKNQLL